MPSTEIPDDVGGADFRNASDLDGCKVVCTGRLEEVTRADFKEIVESYGGKVTNNISQKTDVLVVGDNPGTEKIEFLQEHETPTLTEHGFYSLFPERFKHVDGVLDESGGQSTLPKGAEERVQIELSPLALHLAEATAEEQGEDLSGLCNRSTRNLLKGVIDGDHPSIETPENAEVVEVTLPEGLFAMVETAVETTPEAETVETFVAEAVKRKIGFKSGETQEVKLELPQSAVTLLQKVSQDEEQDMEAVAEKMLLSGLRLQLESP
ncbi:BRCT domain-containing protein [Halopelagius longus]|uniref:BRCA1 C Terminus (BRCT) domain-containing protein n=1 Tax=Halopelagius longus TaxID=1236180 RepID=A0A1H0XP19_9EURY|nr:BRCT domain-containing protein [Halopelagius longus]RDI71989.1 hypothetical protein DWB78_09785 [Halopelagius longus]SDQ04678.1 BRCA1 C Terminus (BRCT) domain-containing protein [Halopelagius longus]